MAAAQLSTLGETVRRADPDRFLTSLFAPAEAREALWTLYAFNHELARAREVVREPMLAQIRLQWWREVVEGARREHEVAAPLTDLLESGRLDRAELAAVVDAREAEVDTVPTHEDWRAAMLAGPGGIALAAGRLLGMPGAPGLRELGAAYGAAGSLRAVPSLARAGRCLLPEDLLAAHGSSVEAVMADPDGPAARRIRAVLAGDARGWLAAGRGARPPRRVLPAALPAALAARDLRRSGPGAPRGLGDRLAVMVAAFTGRI